jgi:hypothetical protein
VRLFGGRLAFGASRHYTCGVSEQLLARMQGKSCFNFKAVDEELFGELEKLTSRSIQGMKKAGFTAEGPAS